MVVSGFRRSISLPLSPSKAARAAAPAMHVRSISLPCRSHPLASLLHSHLLALRGWLSSRHVDPATSTSCLATGLSHAEALHVALDELLLLPDAHAPLRADTHTARLLDYFLLLADAYGSFRSAIVDLKQIRSDVSSATRRHDEARLASAIRSWRRIEKEIAAISAALSPVAKLCGSPHVSSGEKEIEIVGMVRETIAVTAAVSVAVFNAVAGMSSSSAAGKDGYGGAAGRLRRAAMAAMMRKGRRELAGEVLEGKGGVRSDLGEFEGWIGDLESGSERVFRRLVNTRVSLLNIVTPSF